MIEDTYGSCSYQSGEIFPSHKVPILLANGGEIDPDLLTWGFPRWDSKNLIISAKSETASEKKMFSKPLRSMRCIIASSGFYEWKEKETGKGKDKYHFTLPGQNAADLLYQAPPDLVHELVPPQ